MDELTPVTVHIVNAFVDGNAGGNPAGVVVDANRLSSAQKLKVAQSVGLSETAFVSASTTATLKLEFYTPSGKMRIAGMRPSRPFLYFGSLAYCRKADIQRKPSTAIGL